MRRHQLRRLRRKAELDGHTLDSPLDWIDRIIVIYFLTLSLDGDSRVGLVKQSVVTAFQPCRRPAVRLDVDYRFQIFIRLLLDLPNYILY